METLVCSICGETTPKYIATPLPLPHCCRGCMVGWAQSQREGTAGVDVGARGSKTAIRRFAQREQSERKVHPETRRRLTQSPCPVEHSIASVPPTPSVHPAAVPTPAMARGRFIFRTLFAAAFAFALLVCVLSAPAIPFDKDGHLILRTGSFDSPLQVEVYLDLACSDCALAWPVMTQVADAYGQQTNFVYRLFPLPYHSNAFTAAQAAQVVRFYSDSDDAAVERFLTTVFSEQQYILNTATADKTKAEIEAIFELWALATGAVSTAEFQSGMADRDLGLKTRYQFKYGCLHGVYGTPMVFVGGVMAEGLDGDATFQDWKSVLDPLVAQANSAVTR